MNKFLKFLLPATSSWRKRFLLILMFGLADYLVTLSMCTNPEYEANALASFLMRSYGIFPGLTITFLLLNVMPMYFTTVLISRMITPANGKWIVGVTADGLLAWYCGGGHMYAISTWFRSADEMRYIGTVLYLLLALLLNFNAIHAGIAAYHANRNKTTPSNT